MAHLTAIASIRFSFAYVKFFLYFLRLQLSSPAKSPAPMGSCRCRNFSLNASGCPPNSSLSWMEQAFSRPNPAIHQNPAWRRPGRGMERSRYEAFSLGIA
jgi:hypothetical protein